MDAKFSLRVLCSPSPEALTEIREVWSLPDDVDWDEAGIVWLGERGLMHYVTYHVNDRLREYRERIADPEVVSAMDDVLKATKNLEAIIARKFQAP